MPGTNRQDGIGDVVYADGTTRFVPGDPELVALIDTYRGHPDLAGINAIARPEQQPPAPHVAALAPTEDPFALPAPPTEAPAQPTPTAPAAPPGPPPTPTSTDLYQVAAAEALMPKVVPGRAAGYQPAQRTGALDPTVAARQQSEAATADAELLQATELSRAAEAETLRRESELEQARAAGQRADAEQEAREAQARRARFQAEQRDVENMQINADLRHEGALSNVFSILASALGGFIGSDVGLRMIDKRIDTHVRAQMAQQGSKLRRLADAIGSEEQAIAHAKERYYGALQMQLDADMKANRAELAGKQTPVILASLKRQQLAAAHEAETQSLGKATEVYQQARAGGVVRGDAAKAAGLLQKGEQAGADRAKAAAAGKPKPAQQKNINELKRIVDVLERGVKNGAAQSVVGWQNKKLGLGVTSPNDVQKFFGGLPPEQQEVLTAIEELQVNNLMRLVREPNNKRTQDLVQQIGVPQNDRDLPGAIARLRELIAEEEGTAGSDIPPPISEE